MQVVIGAEEWHVGAEVAVIIIDEKMARKVHSFSIDPQHLHDQPLLALLLCRIGCSGRSARKRHG